MSRRTLNLGILAHVDAGKTTLTERLLYAAGVIDEIGSVDDGSTQTDTLALERQRGITIKSAVVSFAIDDVTVNLIDTPGHPDFIAEVERVLAVLDGAVLVISAVEGVQPQTPLLMRALQRLGVPTLIFVNKVDRQGASDERVLAAIANRLTPAVVAMGSVRELGMKTAAFTSFGEKDAAFRTHLAEVLAERNESVLAAYVDDEASLRYPRLREELVTQTKRAMVHPVYFGSAITGAGVGQLMAGIAELLPSTGGGTDGAASGTVFKIERGQAGEKIAYVRMFSGSLSARERVRFGRDGEEKVTALHVFERGPAAQRASVSAGEIAKVWGLGDVRIGDGIGEHATAPAQHFAPPTLESVVVPMDPDDAQRLRVALAQLAEQDPLIDVRQDDERREFSVSLYGEVQKEVVQATLADDFGVDVAFRETSTICIERPVGSGVAVEELGEASNPFLATLGLRVEPAPIDSGVDLRLDVDVRSVPMYVFKTVESFSDHMARYVHAALAEGVHGWRVTDCVVTVVASGYAAPSTGARDFRKLTPLVLMQALTEATTVVCEPMALVTLELPTDAVGAVLTVLMRLGARVEGPSRRTDRSTVEIVLPAARVQDLRRQLPGLTGGEGVLESTFGGYEPVDGPPPARRRTTPNPLNRHEYMLYLSGRAHRG